MSICSSTQAVSSDVAELKTWFCINFSSSGPAPQTHGVSKTDFERYVTANDALLRNMQNQGQNLQSQMANLTDMLSKFVTANTASTSGSGTLPGNTITNPKEDVKGITTRSGVTLSGVIVEKERDDSPWGFVWCCRVKEGEKTRDGVGEKWREKVIKGRC
ncbi:hypothetical protein Tco_1154552 [Tanacetum coccineum]